MFCVVSAIPTLLKPASMALDFEGPIGRPLATPQLEDADKPQVLLLSPYSSLEIRSTGRQEGRGLLD